MKTIDDVRANEAFFVWGHPSIVYEMSDDDEIIMCDESGERNGPFSTRELCRLFPRRHRPHRTLKASHVLRDRTGLCRPNQREHSDAQVYRIQTVPGTTNMSREERTEGWLGTTNDWMELAHGAFLTEGEARDAIKERCRGAWRELECDSYQCENLDPDSMDQIVIARYKPGRYEPCTDSVEWCWDLLGSLKPGTTDEQIEQLLAAAEFTANDEGMTLELDGLRKVFHERRLGLIEDLKDE